VGYSISTELDGGAVDMMTLVDWLKITALSIWWYKIGPNEEEYSFG